VFLITDGGPADEWEVGCGAGSFAFFPVGVQGARMDVLNQISSREPLKLQGLRFRDLFQWLSLITVSGDKDCPFVSPTGKAGLKTLKPALRPVSHPPPKEVGGSIGWFGVGKFSWRASAHENA
jgi:uncharacterized protein YegL